MSADLLHLSRNLRRSPFSAGAVILTLSLTLGVGATIFALLDAVLLTPPPFANPEALVVVGETPADEPAAAPRAVTYATFGAWRDRAAPLAALEAFDGTNLTVTGLGAAERVSASDVTPGFLNLLGVSPALGRLFTTDDVAQPVVVLSDSFWRTKLASDPAVIGRQIVLGATPHIIVGVLPAGFHFALNACDLWRPLPMAPSQAIQDGYPVRVIARLAASTIPAHLAESLDDVGRTAPSRVRVAAIPVTTAIAGDSTTVFAVLAGAAALAVLTAFANLAGLLIVRSIDRRREFAIRTALGAHRSEIVKQLLLEAGALVAIGTVGGVLLALWMTPAVGILALDYFGAVANRDVEVSWRAVTAISLVAFICATICSSLPALFGSRTGAVDVLRRGATPTGRELALRRVFVTAEVTLAFLLLVSMALLGRTLLGMLAVNPGFDARDVVTLQVSLPRATYSTRDRIVAFYWTLQRSLEQRLGAGAPAVVDELPLTGDGGRTLVAAQGSDTGREAVLRTATPGYFGVMRIPVVHGRTFDASDNAEAPLRVVVSEALAKALAVDQPIGRRLLLGPRARPAEVIGVVGEVKHRALDEPSLATVYVSGRQVPSTSNIVVVRSDRPEAEIVAAVREEVAGLDRSIPVYNVRSMQEIVANSPGVPASRLLTAAFTAFAMLAVVLSTVGLFGAAAHDVSSRRTELALRMALGADPMRILRATLGQSALMVGAGLVAGSLLSIWAVRGLSGAVVTPTPDFFSIGLAAAVLVASAVGAVLPVALRAARTDPLIALRSD